MDFQVEWVLYVVLLSKVHLSSGFKKHCAEPSNKELSRKLNDLVPASGVSSAKHLEPGKAFNVSHQHTAQIGERSTSPWSYRINEDPARYPRKLMEAYCLHKGCLGPDGLIDNTVMSVPYHTSVFVLRRTHKCRHNTYIYRLVEEKIPVFCVCVMRDAAKV